ncbi:MAG TPA: hypothetical protein VFF73_40515 [Planctomycetota bacterium]|nr:hypothetical protein [Planctomycetota bacterium]
MSALARPEPLARPDGDPAPHKGKALAFARELLREQKVSPLALGTTSRALALLLERSLERPGEPVVLAAHEGARLCGFEPRTWWLVKRRLLSLGHLVASAGGGPPAGRPGGRGHKAAYFIAPATRARFEQTANALPETLNDGSQTVNAFREEKKPSHHRVLRIFKKEKTSDVLSPETTNERPTVEAIWAHVRREESVRVKLRLLRLLESLLLAEALERTLNARPSSVNAPLSAPMSSSMNDGVNDRAPSSSGKERRPRAATALWQPRGAEEESVLAHARTILEWSNRDFHAHFEVERSLRDMLRYPFEQVRGAVSNVLLKKSRGYLFKKNPGAVLWEGITLEGYKLEEYSVARFSEVLSRLSGTPCAPLRGAPPPSPAPPRFAFSEERKRRALLQAIYEKLPLDARQDLDRRAQALAEQELGEKGSPERLALRSLDHRNALLEDGSRGTSPPPHAMGACPGSEESQNSAIGPVRDETEPNVLPVSRT